MTPIAHTQPRKEAPHRAITEPEIPRVTLRETPSQRPPFAGFAAVEQICVDLRRDPRWEW
jgi:hypothetical protein